MVFVLFCLYCIFFYGRSLEVVLVNDGRFGDFVGIKVVLDVDENISCNIINY